LYEAKHVTRQPKKQSKREREKQKRERIKTFFFPIHPHRRVLHTRTRPRKKAERKKDTHTKKKKSASSSSSFPSSERERERDGARTSRWKREALKSFRNNDKNRRPPFRFLKKPLSLSDSSGAVEEERERWRRCRLRRPRRCFIRRLLLSGRTSARVRGETR